MRAGRRWWSVSDVLLVLLPALTLMACEGWQVDRPPIAPSAESLTAPSSAAVFATTTGLAAQPPPTTSGKIGSSADLASLMKALRSYGLKVRSMGAIENPLLPGRGTALIVNSTDVQVFEYADDNAVQAALAMINPDGSLVGVDMDWDGSPHFYQSGRVIALYVGDNETITKALTKTLGAQIAGWQ